MVPQQAITVVVRELVVEIVEAFAPSPKGHEDAIAWGTLIAVSSVTPVVCQTVDEEGELLNEHGFSEASDEQASEPVTPTEASNQHGHD